MIIIEHQCQATIVINVVINITAIIMSCITATMIIINNI